MNQLATMLNPTCMYRYLKRIYQQAQLERAEREEDARYWSEQHIRRMNEHYQRQQHIRRMNEHYQRQQHIRHINEHYQRQQRVATRRLVESKPIKEKVLAKAELNAPMAEECVICLDKHIMKDSVTTSCGHHFGKDCFQRWNATCSANAHVVFHCPNCRTKNPKINGYCKRKASGRRSVVHPASVCPMELGFL